MKRALEKGSVGDTIFMDLSKVFDTLNHDLLTAKFEGYRFSTTSFRYTRPIFSIQLLEPTFTKC